MLHTAYTPSTVVPTYSNYENVNYRMRTFLDDGYPLRTILIHHKNSIITCPSFLKFQCPKRPKLFTLFI